MLLIFPAEERFWRVAYKAVVDASDVTLATLGKLLDHAQNGRGRETATPCPGWTYSREDLPLEAFVRPKLRVAFGEKLAECFNVMSPLPCQRTRPRADLLRELAKMCDDLPEIRSRFAIQRIAARCDPVLRDLVKEDPGVRVREYNFAAAAQCKLPRINRFRWSRSFPALWGLRNEPRLRELIDDGRPFIKPAAALLDCSAAAIRRFRVIEHSVANLRFRDRQDQRIGLHELDDEQPRERFGRQPEWVGPLDVPTLLLEGLAGLPADKLPPPESLTQLNIALESGHSSDAPVQAVICAFSSRREAADGRGKGRD